MYPSGRVENISSSDNVSWPIYTRMRGGRGRDGSPGITFPMGRRVKRLMDLFIGGLLYLFMGSKAAYWIGDDNNKLIARFIGGFERLVLFFFSRFQTSIIFGVKKSVCIPNDSLLTVLDGKGRFYIDKC